VALGGGGSFSPAASLVLIFNQRSRIFNHQAAKPVASSGGEEGNSIFGLNSGGVMVEISTLETRP
jgi:hypothetical protein